MQTETIHFNINELKNPAIKTHNIKTLLKPKVAKAKRLSSQQQKLLIRYSHLRRESQISEKY